MRRELKLLISVNFSDYDLFAPFATAPSRGLQLGHPEGVKEFAGQRGRSSILDRPPFSKGGLVPGDAQFFHTFRGLGVRGNCRSVMQGSMSVSDCFSLFSGQVTS